MLCHSQKLAPSPGSQQLFADQREHPPTERQAEQSEQLLHCYNRGRAILLSRFSRVGLFATSWTVALQAPLSMGFSRQEYWRGLPFPSPGDLPNPGIEPMSSALQADSLLSEAPGKPFIQRNALKFTFHF